MKLIPMTDFVLEQNKKLKNAPDAYDQYCKMVNYAQFLKQPLELWMFVPCDEDGNVFEIPINNSRDLDSTILDKKLQKDFDSKFLKYQQAKERCLFEGFEVDSEKTVNWNGIYIEEDSFNKIDVEGLEYYCSSTKIQLTQTAIKQLGL